jgi:hypothetical protein
MKPSKESSAPRPPEACIRCRQITMACATPHSHGPMISTAKSQLFSVSQSRSQALVREAPSSSPESRRLFGLNLLGRSAS